MLKAPKPMINIPLDGREIEILKQLLAKAASDETSRFKTSEYNLLFTKLESYRKLHHEQHAKAILRRFDKGE